MKLIKLNPFTNGVRHQLKLTNNLLLKKNRFAKFLLKTFFRSVGRSKTTGRITVRHKGSGCKKSSHVLNSLQFYCGFNIGQMYSSRHSSFVSLNFDVLTKTFFKTISTNKTFPGTILVSNLKYGEHFIGYRMQLKFLPVGSIIHLIGEKNNIIYSCSAGTFCQLIEKKTLCKIRLPSGKIVLVSENLFATLGTVSNLKQKSIVVGKAGRNRLFGIRPTVRGIAMNPVDHPHGGRTNGGMIPVTPWGIPTKGKPTVKKLKKYE